MSEDAKREAKRRAFAWARAIRRRPSRSLGSSVKLAADVIADRSSLVTTTAIVDWALPDDIEGEAATWRTAAALADDMGQSDPKKALAYLRALEDAGWLVVRRRRTRAGYQAASVYLPAVGGVPVMQLSEDELAAIDSDDTGCRIRHPDGSAEEPAGCRIGHPGPVTATVTGDEHAPGMADVDANRARSVREDRGNSAESLDPGSRVPVGQSGTEQGVGSAPSRVSDPPRPGCRIRHPLDRGIPNSLNELSNERGDARAPAHASAHEPARTRGPSPEPIALPDIVPGMLEPRREPSSGHARDCLDMLVRLRGQPRTGDDSRGAQRAAAACGRRALARPERLVTTLLAMARRAGDESWIALGENAERWLDEAREELERVEAERHHDAKPIATVRPIAAGADRAEASLARVVGGRR